jgi:hypothetical protein
VRRAYTGRVRRAALVACLVCGADAEASAQSPAPPAAAVATAPTFLTRADLTFVWARFVTSDPRFAWDAQVEVDIDVLDTRKWRMNFDAHYDAVLGHERRTFDLNQGSYILDGTIGKRFGPQRFEIAFLARHVSRHLVDRQNTPAISWNLAGVRASHRVAVGRTMIDGRLDFGHAMQTWFVDYTWMTEVRLTATRPIDSRLDFVSEATGVLVNVDHLERSRRACGGRIEGALRLKGAAAAVDLVAGYERRVDAFPTDRFRVRTFTLGFRFVSR